MACALLYIVVSGGEAKTRDGESNAWADKSLLNEVFEKHTV